MSVPREPIRLVSPAQDIEDWGSIKLMGQQSGDDYTLQMKEFSARKIQGMVSLSLSARSNPFPSELRSLDIDGYILKALSPTCGLSKSIPLYVSAETRNKTGKNTIGMFAHALVQGWDQLPKEEVLTSHPTAVSHTISQEGRLNDQMLRNVFVTSVFCHFRWTQMLREPKSVKVLPPIFFVRFRFSTVARTSPTSTPSTSSSSKRTVSSTCARSRPHCIVPVRLESDLPPAISPHSPARATMSRRSTMPTTIPSSRASRLLLLEVSSPPFLSQVLTLLDQEPTE